MKQSELINRIKLIRKLTIGPITSRPLISRYGNAKKALEAISELYSRGGKKFSLHASHQRSANMKNLQKLVCILLHMEQIAIENT